MLKFYILISSSVGHLWRHFSPDYSNLSPEETVVVINTTDPIKSRDLARFCEDFDITYHITKSDGTPAKGKNSVLEIFRKSSHDYMVQIDGDDILTPHGVELYRQVAAGKSVPDAICLKEQIATILTGTPWDHKIEFSKFFTVSSVDYDAISSNLSKVLDAETVDRYISYHKEYYSLTAKYVEGNETHSRVVFFSKKAAEYEFPLDHVVGEDTLQYFRLKDAHFRGELVMACNDEAPATYIYDQNTPGIVWKHSEGHRNYDWMDKFNNAVKELNLHSSDLPLLKINYNSPPCMEDYNSAGPCHYHRGDRLLELPANATSSSVDKLWSKYSRSIEK